MKSKERRKFASSHLTIRACLEQFTVMSCTALLKPLLVLQEATTRVLGSESVCVRVFVCVCLWGRYLLHCCCSFPLQTASVCTWFNVKRPNIVVNKSVPSWSEVLEHGSQFLYVVLFWLPITDEVGARRQTQEVEKVTLVFFFDWRGCFFLNTRTLWCWDVFTAWHDDSMEMFTVTEDKSFTPLKIVKGRCMNPSVTTAGSSQILSI